MQVLMWMTDKSSMVETTMFIQYNQLQLNMNLGAEGDPHPGAPEVDPALEPDQLPVEDHPGRGDDGDDPGGGDGDPGGNRHNIGNRLSICSCLKVGNLMYQFYFSFNLPFF